MKFNDSIPIYLQIKEEIEKAIISGALKEEEPISSIRTLAQQYRVNPQTISNAVSELLGEDILYKKRGIGMFVEKGAKAKLLRKKNEEFRSNDLRKVILKAKSIGISRQDLIELMNKIYQEEEE